MNIVLWVLQVVIAFFGITGSIWRYLNYEQASKDVASMGALSQGMWNAIGAFEIICSLGLILPGLFKMKPAITGYAASALFIELLLISALHMKYFGFQLKATNPAVWSLSLCVLAAVVAYGRLRFQG